jgi:amino acid transporter
MKQETVEQTIKAAPALAGTVYSTITLNEMVAVATLAYVVVQLGFLVYKWYWDHKERMEKRDKGK